MNPERARRLAIAAGGALLVTGAAFYLTQLGAPDGAIPPHAAPPLRSPAPGGRVLLVGLDGADWRFLDPLLAAGKMPNLARAIDAGARGTLRSFVPLLSPLLWTTIATGHAPEDHGVLDFFERAPSGELAMVGSGARQVPAIWNIASAARQRVGVIGWWASHPAETVDGVVVSNRINDSTFPGRETTDLTGVVAPAEWTARVEQLRVTTNRVPVGQIRALAAVSPEEIAAALAPEAPLENPLRMLVQTVAMSETTTRLAREAWREFDPRLLMVYYEGTDGIGHLFAPYVEPPVAGAPPAAVARYGRTPEAFYAWIDGQLGELMALLEPADTLLVLSDHGFQWGEGRPPTTESGTLQRNAPLWHALDGVVVVSGGAARRGGRGEGTLYDVTPTLLALLGLPPGAGLRGAPLAWALAAAPPRREPVDYTQRVPLERAAPDRAASEAELAQLRALGYLAGGAGKPSPAGLTERLTPGALNNLGARRLETGDLTAAEEAFRRAIAAEPEYAGAHRNLANVLLRRGETAPAVAAFREALRLGVSDPERAAVEFAMALAEKGDREAAIAVVGEQAARKPDSYLLQLNLGTLLADGGRFDGALAAYRRATEIDPRSALAWRNRGLAALRLVEHDEAARAFTRSLALDPDQPDLQRMVRR